MTARQRGLALIGALLVVAVATALGYEIVVRHSLNVALSRQTLDGAQARQYAFGGEAYARQLLYADWEDEETRVKDTLLEPWSATSGQQTDDDPAAQEYPEDLAEGTPWAQGPDAEDAPPTQDAAVFEVAGGSLEIRIEDLSARFNLNAVRGEESAENVDRLKRLLAHLGLDPNAADAWRDWTDDDQEVSGYGAEDNDYLLRDPPLRAANQRSYHASELIVAASLSAPQYALLRPHIAVLPTFEQRINVNTANAEVLGSLVPNFAVSDAQVLAGELRDYDDAAQVIETYAPLGASPDTLTVASAYFRVQVRATFGDAQTELTSMLHRNAETGALTLLSRSFGEPFEAVYDAQDKDDEDWRETEGTTDEPRDPALAFQ